MPPRNGGRYEVGASSTLGWAGDDTARAILDRVVRRAEVIMRRHQWKVLRVEEFYPRSDRLLGLNTNQGELIQLRLRPVIRSEEKALFIETYNGNLDRYGVTMPRSTTATTATAGKARGRKRAPPRPLSSTITSHQLAKHLPRFFSFEYVMCVMLHELTHCRIRPHSAHFWKLYHSLVAECEALEAELQEEDKVVPLADLLSARAGDVPIPRHTMAFPFNSPKVFVAIGDPKAGSYSEMYNSRELSRNTAAPKATDVLNSIVPSAVVNVSVVPHSACTPPHTSTVAVPPPAPSAELSPKGARDIFVHVIDDSSNSAATSARPSALLSAADHAQIATVGRMTLMSRALYGGGEGRCSVGDVGGEMPPPTVPLADELPSSLRCGVGTAADTVVGVDAVDIASADEINEEMLRNALLMSLADQQQNGCGGGGRGASIVDLSALDGAALLLSSASATKGEKAVVTNTDGVSHNNPICVDVDDDTIGDSRLSASAAPIFVDDSDLLLLGLELSRSGGSAGGDHSPATAKDCGFETELRAPITKSSSEGDEMGVGVKRARSEC